MNDMLHPLAAEHLHRVNRTVIEQTFTEAEIVHSFVFAAFSIHHGVRYGAPIVIVEPTDKSAAGAIWYDESIAGGFA